MLQVHSCPPYFVMFTNEDINNYLKKTTVQKMESKHTKKPHKVHWRFKRANDTYAQNSHSQHCCCRNGSAVESFTVISLSIYIIQIVFSSFLLYYLNIFICMPWTLSCPMRNVMNFIFKGKWWSFFRCFEKNCLQAVESLHLAVPNYIGTYIQSIIFKLKKKKTFFWFFMQKLTSITPHNPKTSIKAVSIRKNWLIVDL